ncbi:hypothetical protein JCM17961_21160 [Endothiovibrio diazotrophicus]
MRAMWQYTRFSARAGSVREERRSMTSIANSDDLIVVADGLEQTYRWIHDQIVAGKKSLF